MFFLIAELAAQADPCMYLTSLSSTYSGQTSGPSVQHRQHAFYSLGSFPNLIERLNNLVVAGVILLAVNFNICAEIPSGPLDLVVSMQDSNSYTSSSVHKRSCGQLSGTRTW